MRVALGLAARGLGRVAPNPSVGAVILKGGRVLGRGVTGAGGRPHAEAVALEQARTRHGAEALAGATAYVTLEPCAHHGLTPPCAESLISAGVARVVCPIEDPDPRVSGRGIARLRAAGVEVETGVLAGEARAFHAGFLSRLERGRPHVTLKLATTLDGRIATASGESRWITGPVARRRAHAMRAASDAVMVGAGTARADDPMLDVRGYGAAPPRPLRLVADGALSLPLTHRLVATAAAHPVTLLARESADLDRRAALEAAGVRVLAVPAGPEGRIDLAAALDMLGAEGVTRLLCEGGGRLAAALIAADRADEIALFQAGRVIGDDGRAGIAGLGLDRLAAAPHFERMAVECLGPDLLTLWRRAPDPQT